MSRNLSYVEALREAHDICMAEDDSIYVMGLGVPDPKGIFGSTRSLLDKFGPERIFDMPLAENAMTGVAIGAAMRGMRPIITHQRVDFAILAMAQMVNQAAKCHYMFGGTISIPLVVRMVIGRGWGQGPQHSQSLQSWFGHIPGLRVIMPATAHDAKGMMISAIEDDNPVICLEYRWLYGITGDVPEGRYAVPIGKARVMREGTDVTLLAASYMSIEAMSAADYLADQGISAEVVDLRSLRPLDTETIIASIRKTGRVVVANTSWGLYGVSAEIVAVAAEHGLDSLAAAPKRVVLPDHPTPTSRALTDDYYPRWPHIADTAMGLFGRSADPAIYRPADGHYLDQPDPSFTGPF